MMTKQEGATTPKKTGKGKRAQVLVVDDHPVVRQGLAFLINREPDLWVCGEAAGAADAVTAIERLAPDAAIVDFSLKDNDGVELIKKIRTKSLGLPILVFSTHDEALYAERALRAGATGYLMKNEPPDRVLSALRHVLRGEVCVSENLTGRLLQKIAGLGSSPAAHPVETLSNREFQVFRWIARGQGTSQIAERLNLSVKTIETYRENLKRKLELENSAELVRYAILWSQQEELG